jgi:hypothetical protein
LAESSAGKCEPAGARFDWLRSLTGFDDCVRSENVERIAARRVDLADQNWTHELVIAIAEKHAIG